MNQSRLISLVESALNTASGFFISWGMWAWVVAPLFGFDYAHTQALSITMIFTVSSLLRSYVIRRFFNNGWHRLALTLTGARNDLL